MQKFKNILKSPAQASLLCIMLMTGFSCQSQTKPTMTDQQNPLLCDPEKGICEIPAGKTSDSAAVVSKQSKPVKIIYFTDPICSSCWGIEPQLRKLKLEYGDNLEIDYRMGGLLPDWSYNSGGISKPSDVAHHWDEVSRYYDMPIDGDVWLEDPLNSSYPPSIAFKAAQLQDKTKAIHFLREIREQVFLEKKNITKWEHISTAAKASGLDVAKLKTDYETVAKENFEQDLAYARSLGVRGFPTLFFSGEDNKPITVYGFKPYDAFETAVLTVYPAAQKKSIDLSSDISLFNAYSTLTPKEYSVLSGKTTQQSTEVLEKLVAAGKLEKKTIKTGTLYKLKKHAAK
jgi:predicted DsbA family dithiol-disulfide isomerase